MKRISRFLSTASVFVLSVPFALSVLSQKHLPKMFEAYAKERKIEVRRDMFENRNPQTGMLELRRNFYTFKLTSKADAKMKKILAVFNKDAPKAYWTFSQSSGAQTLQTQHLVYGEGDKTSVEIGNDVEYNYLALNFKDPKHVGFRFSYVVRWRRVNLNTIEVTLMDLYGSPSSLHVQNQGDNIQSVFEKYYNKEAKASLWSHEQPRIVFFRVFTELCSLYSGEDEDYDCGVATEIRNLVNSNIRHLNATDYTMCRLKLNTLVKKTKKTNRQSLQSLMEAINALQK